MNSFFPASNQQRWVRGNFAAIRNRRGAWIHFQRNDVVSHQMIDAPYDHNDSGVYQSQSRSFWNCPSAGAQFASMNDAWNWVQNIPN